MDQLDHLEKQVSLVNVELLVLVDLQDNLACKVREDHLVNKAQLVHLVNQENEGFQANQEDLVCLEKLEAQACLGLLDQLDQ